MSCSYDLRQIIASAALAAGVDPGIALAVASRESGICQWNADGSVKRGSAGEYGVFQVEQATAPGVDLSDLNANIAAGVGYLAQMYSKYGRWDLALAAYNWGPAKLDRAISAGTAIPAVVVAYAQDVMARAGVQTAAVQVAISNQTPMAPDGTTPGPSVAAAPPANNNTDVGSLILLGTLGLGAAWYFFGD